MLITLNIRFSHIWQKLWNTVRAMDGKIAYVIMGQKEIAEKDISYEDIHCISTILRDCDDIELGFTMYEDAPSGLMVNGSM
jgi:bifunctional oligoribonuclease and PAP phosphatase NrnA